MQRKVKVRKVYGGILGRWINVIGGHEAIGGFARTCSHSKM